MSNTETWYVCPARNAHHKPRPIQVHRHTEKSVWITSWFGEVTRRSKITEYECVFPTYEEAIEYMIEMADEDLEVSKARTQKLKSDIARFAKWRAEGP